MNSEYPERAGSDASPGVAYELQQENNVHGQSGQSKKGKVRRIASASALDERQDPNPMVR